MALVVLTVRKADVRKSVAQVGQAFFKPTILISFVGFYVYLTVIVSGAKRLGLWEAGLLSETVLWYLVGGLGMLWSVNEAEKDPRFFAKALRRLFAGTVLVELFFELETFPLWVELIIQPILMILILMELFARGDPEQAQAAGCLSGMLATAGFLFLAATAFLIVRHTGAKSTGRSSCAHWQC